MDTRKPIYRIVEYQGNNEPTGDITVITTADSIKEACEQCPEQPHMGKARWLERWSNKASGYVQF